MNNEDRTEIEIEIMCVINQTKMCSPTRHKQQQQTNIEKNTNIFVKSECIIDR